jgi:hypothetical protein
MPLDSLGGFFFCITRKVGAVTVETRRLHSEPPLAGSMSEIAMFHHLKCTYLYRCLDANATAAESSEPLL